MATSRPTLLREQYSNGEWVPGNPNFLVEKTESAHSSAIGQARVLRPTAAAALIAKHRMVPHLKSMETNDSGRG